MSDQISTAHSLTLPIPPSANRYWRSVGGRVLVSQEARDYKATAGWMAKAQGCDMATGEVTVHVDVFRPQRRGDLDNYLKILLDAMAGILWADDDQITGIVAHRYDDKDDPRVEIVVLDSTPQVAEV